jgi:hypothetical protein
LDAIEIHFTVDRRKSGEKHHSYEMHTFSRTISKSVGRKCTRGEFKPYCSYRTLGRSGQHHLCSLHTLCCALNHILYYSLIIIILHPKIDYLLFPGKFQSQK